MKSVMLHVADDDGFDGRLQVALDLVREFDGHLTCLQPVAFEIVFAGDFYGGSAALALDTARDLARSHREEVEAHLANEDIRWSWISDSGDARSGLLENASLQDVGVMTGRSETGENRGISSLVGSIAIHARTPLLVVPPELSGIDVDRPAIVAWNGSVEAANALRSAVPVLKRAKAVSIVVVGEDAGHPVLEISARAAAAYLSRHDISSEVIKMPVDSKGVAHTLLDAAEAREAGCIVMGAYGHSRLREMILGGTTRDLIGAAKIPLLMAH